MGAVDTIETLNSTLTAKKATLSTVDESIIALTKALKPHPGTSMPGYVRTQYTTQLAALRKKKNTLVGQISELKKRIAALSTKSNNVALGVKDVAPPPDYGKAPKDGMAQLNLSACRELYFRPSQHFMAETVNGTRNVPQGYLETTSYKRAKELWSKGSASKGMFQTWDYPKGVKQDDASTIQAGGKGVTKTNPFPGRHAFQFHYNPGSIGMSYEGFPDVDLGMYVASPPKTNAYGMTGSTISFALIINRMPDMKYIDPSNKDYKRRVNGKVLDYSRDVYNREPYIDKATGRNELKDIYNKGTMYDVDHFLRVLMGFTIPSQLRGGERTADIGFINPQPVELHLGAGLRYLVSIQKFDIEHVIFNERMVPLFSTVSITASRIPDWTSANSTKDGNWE